MDSVANWESVEAMWAAERPRLVRLCARLSGRPEAAEDLAQETLLAAWKSLDRLDEPGRLSPWLSGIARNVCLNWSRRHYWEQGHIASLDRDETRDDLVPDMDLMLTSGTEAGLDGNEWPRLLDRALMMLPAETALILRDHYVNRTPEATLAAELRIATNALAVRLHRGKAALRRVLTTTLREDALACGLIREQADTWEETHLWCPICGERRLLGKLPHGGQAGWFALHCPLCAARSGEPQVALDLSLPYHAQLIGDLKTYKRAYTRLLTTWADLYGRAMAERRASCPVCGHMADMVFETHKRERPPYQSHQMILWCGHCGWATNNSLVGMVMARPEAQRFWREHPRFRTLPPEVIDYQGSPAILTRLQSLTASARLDAIARRDTLEVLTIHTQASPTINLAG